MGEMCRVADALKIYDCVHGDTSDFVCTYPDTGIEDPLQ
jgi:hypothetical protein